MLRHARSSRSPGLSTTPPQTSPGYSAIAWARMRAYSSGVRIIEGESAAESRPASYEGRRAPREGGNNRHLVSFLERGLQSRERLDGLAVHIEVHVVVNLARLVAHEALERAEPSFQLVEQALHVARPDGGAGLVVGGPRNRRRR